MQLLGRIEECLDNSDLVMARKYIDENMDLLMEHKNHLGKNARELLEVLQQMPVKVSIPLTQQEMNIVHAWNTYASNFDLRGLKLSIKNNPDLLMREDFNEYLNADAKVLLAGMSAI